MQTLDSLLKLDVLTGSVSQLPLCGREKEAGRMIHEVCTSLVQNAGGGRRCRLTAEPTKKERKQGRDKTPEHPGQRPAWKERFWDAVVAGGRKDA